MTDTIELSADTSPAPVCEWLRDKGYSVAVMASIPAYAGLVFSKGNEAARLAVIGQTLEHSEKTGKVRVIQS